MPIVVLAFSTATKRRSTADLRHLALPAMWALAFGFLGVGGSVDVPEAAVAGVLAGAQTLAWMTLPVLRRRLLGASAILTVVLIAVLRDSAGGSASGYGPLVMMPVLAVALYGNRGQLWRTIAAVAVALVAPTLLIGSPHYAPGSWRLSVFLIISAAVVGAVVQELLLRERRGAAKHVRLLGAIGDGVLVTDIRGRILEVNQALCSTTGFAAEELLGRVPPYPTWPAGHRATIGAAYRSAIAAGGGEFEAPLQRRDGTPVRAVIRVAVEPGTAHDAPAVIATVKDVTEPVRLREAIREERDRTAAVIAGMDEGFCVTRDGAILDVNPALCRITGFSREQLVGAVAPLPFWPPEALPELEAAREQVRATGSGSAEVTFMRADGSRFPGDFTSTRLPSDQDGTPTFLNTIRDITERKAAERAAARRADELAAIAAVTRAVSRAEPAEARAKVCEVALDMTAAAAAAIWEPGPDGDLRPVCVLAGSPSPTRPSTRPRGRPPPPARWPRARPGAHRPRPAPCAAPPTRGTSRSPRPAASTACSRCSGPTAVRRRATRCPCSSCSPTRPRSRSRAPRRTTSSSGSCARTPSPACRTAARSRSAWRASWPPCAGPACRSPSRCSTSTTSRRTTTPTATRPATRCWPARRRRGARACARRTCWPAGAARSSACCCRAARRRTPWP